MEKYNFSLLAGCTHGLGAQPAAAQIIRRQTCKGQYVGHATFNGAGTIVAAHCCVSGAAGGACAARIATVSATMAMCRWAAKHDKSGPGARVQQLPNTHTVSWSRGTPGSPSTHRTTPEFRACTPWQPPCLPRFSCLISNYPSTKVRKPRQYLVIITI